MQGKLLTSLGNADGYSCSR